MRDAARWLVIFFIVSACGVREPGLEVHVSLVVDSPLDLDTATLALEQIELTACEVATPWWVPLLPISTAWAHGSGDVAATPRRLMAPVLIDLTAATATELGSFKPPPGPICELSLTFAPSTADAREHGTTLFFEAQGFRQLSTKRLVVSVPVSRLPVDESNRVQTLQLTLSPTSPLATGDASLEAVLASLRW